ncbi:hypothetical protein MCAP1_001068 [Malassezia caprae]|uniref:Uncharacterized protein n=1 Tax=Malassezia caprae TaxID=1381934 RepID=A0AAF0E8W3_9BASI|nr:hypothetical protein MCAP1_001068 [Malassezia caprae]
MAWKGWHTDKPQRIKCVKALETALPPAAPVFQSDLAGMPHDAAPFFETPKKETLRTAPSDPPSDGDNDSPGVARAASPSAEAHVRRDYVREALGDVSNFSPSAPVYSLKDSFSPLRIQSTPLRRSIHLPPTSSAKKTPVQMALQDWAGAKFSRPLPALEAPSPCHGPSRHLPMAQESLSSPVKLGPAEPMGCDARVPRASSLEPTKSTAQRLPVHRVAVSPQPPAQRVPGFVRAPPSAASPAKRVVGASPVQPVAPEVLKSSPLPRIPSPEKDREASGPSPSTTSRLWRPARYASQAPAVRVWDSPEKIESHKRLRTSLQEPKQPVPSPVTDTEPAPVARRVSTRLLRRTAVPPPVESASVSRSPGIADGDGQPLPVCAQREVRRDACAPAPSSGTSALRTRMPRTPKAPPVPLRPQLSATELARLTQRHTKHNETYTVQLDTQVERVPGPRPPSPSQHFLQGRGVRARENFQPVRSETDEWGEPLGHAYGAGDEDEYSTPPGKHAVRWDKRLVISPTQPTTSTQDKALPRRSCLVAKPVALDAFGNVAGKPIREGTRRRVLIKRRIYDDEEDVA